MKNYMTSKNDQNIARFLPSEEHIIIGFEEPNSMRFGIPLHFVTTS